MPLKPVVLCILDGWGLRDDTAGNAPKLANTPNFDRIWAAGPTAKLSASGEDVGLPPGQMGNSEVGHTNIGAGRVVWMDLPRINNAIDDGSFFSNEALALALVQLKATGGTAHIIGLLSPGGVHSHQRHIAMLATTFSSAGIPVAIHAFMDGRDVPPDSGRGANGILSGRYCRNAEYTRRHGLRPVLCHGSRQALGPGGTGLQTADGW